jgi:hypothetical protein
MDTENITQAQIDQAVKRLENEKNAILANRSFYKWLLDILRNCMVVAALAFLARRSGDWWIYGIAGVSYLALTGYCNSYIQEIVFDLNMKGGGRRVFWTVWAVAEVMTLAIIIGLFLTIDRIVTIQALRP